jgi:hypothetical protein
VILKKKSSFQIWIISEVLGSSAGPHACETSSLPRGHTLSPRMYYFSLHKWEQSCVYCLCLSRTVTVPLRTTASGDLLWLQGNLKLSAFTRFSGASCLEDLWGLQEPVTAWLVSKWMLQTMELQTPIPLPVPLINPSLLFFLFWGGGVQSHVHPGP